MTNPTPHGQVPEALRLADEFKLCNEYDSIPSITDIAKAEAELRRLHAYCRELEAQVIRDCMTHVQNPAEIEHVAGDVSKNGAEANMMDLIDAYAEARHVGGCHTYNAKTAEARSKVIAALRTQQPALAGATEEVENLRKALVYVAFALHDTPQYMLAQGIALIDGDTVRVSRDGWTVEASVNPHRQPAPATQQAGETVDLVGVRDNGEHVNLGKIAMPPRMKAREIAQSQFGAFEDDDGSDAEMCFGALEELLDWLVKQGWAAAPQPSPRAQAADSVLEDVARLTTEQEYAIRQGHEIAASEAYFGARSKLDTNRNHNIFTAGFERGWDAARKQGANHD